MINGMYLSTMGALAQSQRHATISNNLANANTHGFKPDWSIFQAVPTENEFHPERRFLWDKILMQTGGGVWNDATVTNLREGPFQVTGNPLDVALHNETGSGKFSFFMIQSGGGGRPAEPGEILYTRDGHFVTNEAGELRTVTGDQVLSPDGVPVVLAIPENGQIHVRDDGTIIGYTNEGGTVELGQIGIARTADYKQMKKIGDSRFRAEDAEMEIYQAGAKGEYLEESSTNAIDEMVNMIEASRIYETNMRFLSIQDDTLGQTVRRVGASATS